MKPKEIIFGVLIVFSIVLSLLSLFGIRQLKNSISINPANKTSLINANSAGAAGPCEREWRKVLTAQWKKDNGSFETEQADLENLRSKLSDYTWCIMNNYSDLPDPEAPFAD
jgi:hypothetical protein